MSRLSSLFFVTVLITLMFYSLVIEASENIGLYVNGKLLETLNPPIKKGTVYLLPLEDTFKAIGVKKLTWDKSKKKVTVVQGSKTINLEMNSNKAIINGKPYILSNKLQKEKVAMIPIEIFRDLTNSKVFESSKKVEINYKDTPFDIPNEKKKKVANGDFISFSIPVKNNSSQTKELFIAIPSGYQNEIEATEKSLVLLPGKTAAFHIKSKNPVLHDTKKNFVAAIYTDAKLKMQVNLGYESSSYTLVNQVHPNSFINENQLLKAKQRIQSVSWAEIYWRKLKSEADNWLKKDLNVPSQPAGHSSWYICQDGSPLKTVSKGHYCTSDKSYYYGEKFDGGQLYYQYNSLVQALKILSEVYALSEDKRYGVAAKNILLDFADQYPTFMLQEKGGRMYWQSLDEATSMNDIIQSYDFLYRGNLLSDQDKRNIEMNFILPSAETLGKYSMGRSNWQAWENAAIGMAGFVTGNQTLIKEALNGKNGFEYLMKNGVLEDGFWWEGSMAYHSYTLASLNILAQAAANNGYDLFSNPSLKKMFDAPILYVYPNLVLPSNNDGGAFGTSLIGSISSRGFNEYELAYSKYHDFQYSWLLENKYKNLARSGDFALFFGEDNITNQGNVPVSSYNFKSIGHGILRSDSKSVNEQSYLLMDYGPHGGSHGHFDKLAIDLFGAGRMLAPDFGTPGYSHPLYRSWYKQTISHNTVVIDGVSQQESTGEMITFANQKDFQYMNAKANQSYKGVEYERSVWMDSNYILDWFHVSDSKNNHNYDWFLHGLGTLSTDIKLKAVKSPAKAFGYNKNGYELLSKISSFQTLKSFEVSWNLSGNGFRLYSILGGQPSIIYSAEGPGPSNKPNEKTPMVVQRQSGKSADFVNIYQPYNQQNIVKINGIREGKDGVRVDLEKESNHYFKPLQLEDILAVKAVTKEGVFLKIEDLIKTEKVEGDIFIQVTNLPQLEDLSILLDSHQVNDIFLNGEKVGQTNIQTNQVIIKYNKINNKY
jgi:hypothetical protein